MKKALSDQAKRRGSQGKILQSTLFGAVCGLLSLAVLLAVFSVICLFFASPHKFIAPLCIFSVFSSAFLCGFASVKKNRGAALICGGLSGTAFMLAIWALSLIMSFIFKISPSGSISLILKLLIIPTALLGSVCGVGGDGNSTKKIRHKF